jgi:hypothetical protein
VLRQCLADAGQENSSQIFIYYFLREENGGACGTILLEDQVYLGDFEES